MINKYKWQVEMKTKFFLSLSDKNVIISATSIPFFLSFSFKYRMLYKFTFILTRHHANLLCIVLILVYVLPKRVQWEGPLFHLSAWQRMSYQ